MHIKQLASRVKNAFECEAVDENGDVTSGKVNIVVNRLAARTIDQADFKEKLKKGDDSLEDMVNVLIEHNCIAEWDVFEDEAHTVPYPITTSNILDQPFDFVAGLINAVTEKLFPNMMRATNSPDGSAQTDKLASAARATLPDTD